MSTQTAKKIIQSFVIPRRRDLFGYAIRRGSGGKPWRPGVEARWHRQCSSTARFLWRVVEAETPRAKTGSGLDEVGGPSKLQKGRPRCTNVLAH